MIETVLEKARWAPSADNSQPWKFEVLSKNICNIHFTKPSSEGLNYKYFAVFTTIGIFLETLKIAASEQGYKAQWEFSPENPFVAHVKITKNKSIEVDPLVNSIESRSVDRFPYKKYSLTKQDKQAIEAALPEEFQVEWHESTKRKWSMTRMNILSTSIRLSSQFFYEELRKTVDLSNNTHSPQKLPFQALGLSTLSMPGFKFTLKSWTNHRLVNNILGGRFMAHFEVDILPGMNCTSHFTLTRKDGKALSELNQEELVQAGAATQRFWLALASRGFSMQPCYGPITFSNMIKNDKEVNVAPDETSKAAKLRTLLLLNVRNADSVFFLGRMGISKQGKDCARSVRLPLEELLISN